jgi:14-3-3 protein epsilon
LLEIQSEVRRDITRAKALESYSAAHAIALKDLKPADPVRLGVALNFSVFYHENLHSHDLACEIAKKAFDDAFVELNSTEDPWNPETTTIMQLIKENLTAWMGDDLIVAEMQDAEDEELAAAQVGPGSRLVSPRDRVSSPPANK